MAIFYAWLLCRADCFLIVTSFVAGIPVVLLLLLMMVVAMLITILGNWVIERVAYRPSRGSFHLAPLITTAIGMSIALSNFIQVTQGPRNKPILSMVTESYHFGAITVSLKRLVIMCGHLGAALRLLVYRPQGSARTCATRHRTR